MGLDHVIQIVDACFSIAAFVFALVAGRFAYKALRRLDLHHDLRTALAEICGLASAGSLARTPETMLGAIEAIARNSLETIAEHDRRATPW